jgi:long-chain acyl-CoA synthetase
MAEVATPWLDSYPPGVPEHVEVPQVNLARLLADAAREFPHAPALHFEGRITTYAELAERSWRLAGVLAGLGVTRGTRVGLLLPNCPQVVAGIFATLRLGGTVVLNNPIYTESELEHQLGDAGVEVLICLDLMYEKVAPLRERLGIREIIVTSLLDELPTVKRTLAPYTRRGREASAQVSKDEPVLRWRELLRRVDHKPAECEVDPASDLALLQYTGGTTGRAKGVMLSHANLNANIEQVRAWFPDADPGHEVMMAVLPFFHVYGLTVCLLLGIRLRAALVLLPRFDTSAVVASIDRHRPTLFPGVPTCPASRRASPAPRRCRWRWPSGSSACPAAAWSRATGSRRHLRSRSRTRSTASARPAPSACRCRTPWPGWPTPTTRAAPCRRASRASWRFAGRR